MKMKMMRVGILSTVSERRDRALNPDTKSRNLYSPILFNIRGVSDNKTRESIELKMYIKLTFFSEEKVERKLELK